MAEDFYELLDAIRLRPGLYVSPKSVTALYNFIGGYLTASGHEIGHSTQPPYREFNNWVAMKLGLYESTSGWRNMLLKDENADEEKAFDRFFVLFDEFEQRQAKVLLWVKLPLPTTPKVWRIQIDGERRTEIQPPSLVQIIKYTDDKGAFTRYVDEVNEIIEEDYAADLDTAFFRTESLVKKDEWQQ